MRSGNILPAQHDSKLPQGHSRLLRFIIVGSSNFLIGLLLFYCVMQLNIVTGNTRIILAQTVAYVIGGSWSFFWNRIWAFSDAHQKQDSILGQSIRFALLQIGMYLGSIFCLLVFIQVFEMPYIPGWIVSTAIITVSSFLAMSYWIFPAYKRKHSISGAKYANH